MKTISFYNEKGGVGKSSFSIMYASFLHHRFGRKVAVADFNGRIEMYRNDEKREKTKLKTIGNYDGRPLWDIVPADKAEIDRIKKSGLSPAPNALWFQNQIRERLKDYDVVIVDLPGATSGDEFRDLSFTKSISLYCLVLDRNIMTARATIGVIKNLKYLKEENMLGFINRTQTFIPKREYQSMMEGYKGLGLKVLPDLIANSERMNNTSNPHIIASTYEYPDWSNKAFEGSGDLGLDNLFIDVTKELDRKEDIKGTRPADLSFVHSLEKTFQEKRQLRGSSFPEYEFPAEMFKK